MAISPANSKVPQKGAAVSSDPAQDQSSGGDEHPSFDTSVAHVARIYDYWLGGKDNYAVDRAAGDAVSRYIPISSTRYGPTGPSWPVPCVTWPPRPGSASSWTSGPASPPRTTPTRSPRTRRPTAGSST